MRLPSELPVISAGWSAHLRYIRRMNKTVANADAAIDGLVDDMTLMVLRVL